MVYAKVKIFRNYNIRVYVIRLNYLGITTLGFTPRLKYLGITTLGFTPSV